MVTFAHYPDSGMSYPDPNSAGGYPPPPEHSQYPPPPGSEEDERRAYHQRGPSASAVTLPSISPYEYSNQPTYAPDPRGPPGGYAPDPYGQPPQGPPQYRDDRGGYQQQDYGRGGGGMGGAGGNGGQMTFNQSAPRQRTAIACRYCRRRKIRCSGFDQSPAGRCLNCERFQQECIFTPVSSQAQAFVPAHAVYPGMRNMGIGPDGRTRQMYPQGTQLYGAHGQPLGQPLGPAPHQQQQIGYDYPAPSPTGSYRSYGGDEQGPGPQYPQQGPSSQHPQNSSSQTLTLNQPQHPHPQHDQSRKRPQQDPHPSILPPPMPGPAYARSDSANRRQAVEDDLRLPPVTPTAPGSLTTNPATNPANYSPGSSTSSHSNLQPPQSGPVMSRTPPPRSSPGEGSRQDPMSLGNIMQGRPDTQIDRSMLGRLDRPPRQ